MLRVVVTPEAITLDGRPALIQAGALHYFRLPHADLWSPVLDRIRMGGLNAVLVPLPWSYHSPEAGFHDFTGPRDLGRLFDDVERAGLWLIPHLGPWVGAGLDAGGLPAWALALPDASSFIAQGTPFAPASPLLRHVSVWWHRASEFFSERPNLIAVMIDLGPTTGPDVAVRSTRSLLDVLRLGGISVPVAVPDADQLTWEAGLIEFSHVGIGDVAANRRVPHLALLDASHARACPGSPPAVGRNSLDGVDLPLQMALPLSTGSALIALSPGHAGTSWGRWTPTNGPAAYGTGAPVGEGAALHDAYYPMRRMALAFETLGLVLADAGPAQGLSADPPELLAAGRSGPAGTVAFVRGREGLEPYVALTMAHDSGPITVGDVPVPRKSAALLPMDWQLLESRLQTTTMEPVLRTVVAGRELLILQNAAGGEVVLPPTYRVRHRRGPVYIERTPRGVLVHFDPARLGSAVLDGDQGPLQLLVLDSALSERTWPLDDLWRTTPAFPATWGRGGDQPARGVVIGADFAIPEPGGGFRIQKTKKGFGYRWGPWRGSDPHTWLAPLSWTAAQPIEVPALTWTSRAGAPEVLPEYDAHAWIEVVPQRGLAPSLYGIHYGFVWYRGYFSGGASSVSVVCSGACDLFLNGIHIASLNPSPEPAPLAVKNIPLPSRHLRAKNALAVLVEQQGRIPDRGYVIEPQGLLSCELDGARFDRVLVKGGLTGEARVQGFYGFADWNAIEGDGAGDIMWHRAAFDLLIPEDREGPLYVFLDQTPTVCLLYLNGHLIGRSQYPQGAQRHFWLPDGLLRRRGSNELLIAQWTRGADPGLGVVRLEAGAVWSWRTEGGSP